MKKKFNYETIIGIDISKKTLDICLTNNNEPIFQTKIDNTAQGLKSILKKLKSLHIRLEETLFCCENTGIYTSPLLFFAQKHTLNLWVENPLSIKKSLGLTRGKSDKADAHRIAQYAYRYQDQYRRWTPARESIKNLETLWKRRKSVVKIQNQLNNKLKEIKSMQGKTAYNQEKSAYKGILQGIKKDITKIEKELKEAIVSDKELKHLHEIITSVDGVGSVTATYLIVLTDGFKTLNNPRKLACYAGVAPFEHTSGTSVRGKQRTSSFANKELKALLHLCTLSLLKTKNTFSDFIQRKKAAGKHMMPILNALRNKLLHTICACVRKNEKYEENYANSLA